MIINKLLNYNSSKYVTDDGKGDIRNVDRDLNNIFLCLQGRVRFGEGISGHDGENIDGEWQVIPDTGNADTQFVVNHDLGSIPIGYLVTTINKGGVVYDSGTPWSSNAIYLKCSAANAKVTLFLLH